MFDIVKIKNNLFDYFVGAALFRIVFKWNRLKHVLHRISVRIGFCLRSFIVCIQRTTRNTLCVEHLINVLTVRQVYHTSVKRLELLNYYSILMFGPRRLFWLAFGVLLDAQFFDIINTILGRSYGNTHRYNYIREKKKKNRKKQNRIYLFAYYVSVHVTPISI